MPVPGAIQRLMGWTNRGIQRRLIVWTIAFWVVAISIIGMVFLWIGQNEILNETRQRNVQIASVVSRDINSQVSGIFSDIRDFSRYLEMSSPSLETQASAMLALRLSSPQRYRAIYYFDSEGNLLFSLADNLESLLSIQAAGEVVRRPSGSVDAEIAATYRSVNGGATFVSDVHLIGIDRVPVVNIGVPIHSSGREARVVVVQLDLRHIWQRIDLSTVGDSGFTYAVARNGIIIAHPERAFIGRPIAPELEPLLAGYEGFTEYLEPQKQRPVFAAYSPVGGSIGWGIVVEQDESEANTPLFRAGLISVSIWLALALAGMLGIVLIMRSFTRPVQELTRITQTIASTGVLTKTSMEQRPDEVGQLSQSFDLMIDRLQATEGKLATAAAEERSRLARDLHDAVTQTLFSASLIAEVLPRLWERNQPEALRRVAELRQLTRGALAEMRTLLVELRPGTLSEMDLGTLLRQLTEATVSRARLETDLRLESEGTLPADVKVGLYRIAQEALNNVTKHSAATRVTVELYGSHNQARIRVSDNGRGFNPARVSPGHLGLGIMWERAASIGAALTIKSAPDRGTQVLVLWPAAGPEDTS